MLITNIPSPAHKLARQVIRNSNGIFSTRLIAPFIAVRATKNVPTNLSRVAIDPQLILTREWLLPGKHYSVL
jgi:hypothetical protein